MTLILNKIIPSKEQLAQAGQAFKLIRPAFGRYRLRVIGGFLALMAVDSFQLLIPRVIKRAVDDLGQGLAGPASLLRQGGTIIALALGIAVFRFSWRLMILGFSRLMERDLRNRLLSRLMGLDRSFFNQHPGGEIMALSSNDLAAVQMAAGMGLVSCADAVMMTTAAVACMIYIHPGLTIIALSPMPVLATITGLLSALLHRRFKAVQEQFARITEMSRTTLSSIQLVKAYTQEEEQVKRFDRAGQEYIKDNLRLAVVQGGLWPFSSLIASTSLLLVVFFGGRLTIAGDISIGDFVAFMTYLYLMTWPMMALGWVANLFQRGVTSLVRLDRIINTESALKDPEQPITPGQQGPSISCRGLSFSHSPGATPVLKDIDLELKPGLIGIIGRTGSGKTTLCQLLARCYPVPNRSIFWNGADVNQLTIETVRKMTAYVPQTVVLFSDTIAANICFGRPEAPEREIIQAARAAAVHDEIMQFPKGYDTRIGEQGVLLSGGQRQRIALARALLLNRPILIIDDGLSAVDTDTEHRIINQYSSWLPGRLCIMVSHRLAPIIPAKQIIVMTEGRITARGTHQELLKENEFYRTVYHHQVEEDQD